MEVSVVVQNVQITEERLSVTTHGTGKHLILV